MSAKYTPRSHLDSRFDPLARCAPIGDIERLDRSRAELTGRAVVDLAALRGIDERVERTHAVVDSRIGRQVHVVASAIGSKQPYQGPRQIDMELTLIAGGDDLELKSIAVLAGPQRI